MTHLASTKYFPAAAVCLKSITDGYKRWRSYRGHPNEHTSRICFHWGPEWKKTSQKLQSIEFRLLGENCQTKFCSIEACENFFNRGRLGPSFKRFSRDYRKRSPILIKNVSAKTLTVGRRGYLTEGLFSLVVVDNLFSILEVWRKRNICLEWCFVSIKNNWSK